MVKITENSVSKMACAKTFTENTTRINCIDMSRDGLSMITSSDDDSIVVYNLSTGQRDKGVNVNSKKYGVGLIRYTHNVQNALHSSTKVDDTIRYLSLHDNKYLRYFAGHSKPVTCLCMSPVDDQFISASLDNSIRLWDVRIQTCQGLMQVNGRSVAAFDPEGLIFAAGINNEYIKLYDLRSFDKGPFNTFKLQRDSMDWTGMEFSPCGKMVLLNTNGDSIKLVDAFTGNIKHTLRGHRNDRNQAIEATFTPDANYVFAGSSDSHIYGWSTETGNMVANFPTEHDGLVHLVRWNPKHFMMASACSKLSLWIASEEAEE